MHDKSAGVYDHEIAHKLYNLLWLHLVGHGKDTWHKTFMQLICSTKDSQSFFELKRWKKNPNAEWN